MLIDEEQLKKQTCGLSRRFLSDYKEENGEPFYNEYDSNDLLDFLFDYPEINDKAKQRFFYICVNEFKDVPKTLKELYLLRFGIKNCGTYIANSYACSNCNAIVDCNLLSDSLGCSKCKFSDHLIYCTDQRHKSYMAFNKDVTKKRFKELIKLTPEQLKNTPEFNSYIFENINSQIENYFKVKNNAT